MTVQHLRALVAQDRPNLVFLMETKNKKIVIDKVRRQLQFQQAVIVDPIGIARGLAVLSNEGMEVVVEDSSKEFIDVSCRDQDSGNMMHITFLHASTIFQERL